AGRFFSTLLQSDAMKGLASGTISDDLCQHLHATSLSVLVFFEHVHPGTLGEYEAVSIRRERARAFLRRMIPLASHDLHQDETLHNAERDRRIRASAQDAVSAPRLNLPCRIVERVSGRGASSRDDVAGPAKPEADAEVAGESPHDGGGDAMDAHLPLL